MPPGTEKYSVFAEIAVMMLGMYLSGGVSVDSIDIVNAFPDSPGARQVIRGDNSIVCSLQEVDGGLLEAASGLAGEDFGRITDEDALDAAGELLNFISGAYAEKMSAAGTVYELEPPVGENPLPESHKAGICRMDLSTGKKKLCFSFGETVS